MAKISLPRLGTAICLIVVLAARVQALAGEREARLAFGVVGQEHGKFSRLIGQPAIQSLLRAIAEAPRTERWLAQTADGTASVDALFRQNLLRRRDGRVYLNFTYLRNEDVVFLLDRLPPYAWSLAKAILSECDRLDPILARLGQSELSRDVVAMVVVGCFALDWDGLDITAELGLRRTEHLSHDGVGFIPWAFELRRDELRGLYWGSHNEDSGQFRWTTFGDHHALPRRALPDIFWQSDEALYSVLQARSLPPSLALVLPLGWTVVSEEMLSVLMDDWATVASRLRRDLPAERVAALEILRELGYVKGENGEIRTGILVLTERDAAALRESRSIVANIVRRWLIQNASRIEQDVRGLTPLQQGVNYNVVFNQVWHFLFALVNREFMRLGYFADPYGSQWKWRGFVPFVWDRQLVGQTGAPSATKRRRPAILDEQSCCP